MVRVNLMATLLFWHVSTTSLNLSMRGRYNNEIGEWKWPPIFQNKRVRHYARGDELELYSSTVLLYQESADTNLLRRGFTLVHALSVDGHKHSPARMRYS